MTLSKKERDLISDAVSICLREIENTMVSMPEPSRSKLAITKRKYELLQHKIRQKDEI